MVIALTSIEIPKEVYEIISTVARRKGKTIEELLVELALPELDLEARVGVYLKLHKKYLNEAEKLYEMGNLIQASEKYWGAVTTLLKAIAEVRGRVHSSHRDLRELASQLYRETKDKDIAIGCKAAGSLHANYHESYMTREDFELTRELVLKLIRKLEKLAREPGRGRRRGSPREPRAPRTG